MTNKHQLVRSQTFVLQLRWQTWSILPVYSGVSSYSPNVLGRPSRPHTHTVTSAADCIVHGRRHRRHTEV